MPWDVMGGVARRAWARNGNSITTSMEWNKDNKGTDHITLPYIPSEDLIKSLVAKKFN
jgi:urocanate hydratase